MLNIGMYPFYVVMIIFIIVALSDVFSIPFNKKSKTALYYFLIIILICFAGLRKYEWPAGVDIFDYGTYEYTYLNPISLSNFIEEFSTVGGGMGSLDPGYVWVSSFFSQYITSSPNLFFLLISTVSILLLIKSFKQNDIKTALLLILFVFFARLYLQYNFIMMRQGLAMVICWSGLQYIVERKFWKFAIICLIAGVFHFSAFLFLVAYWLPKFKFSNKFIAIVLPSLFIISALGITKAIILGSASAVLDILSMGRLMSYIDPPEGVIPINMLNYIEIAPFFYIALKNRSHITSTPTGKFFFNMLIFYIIFVTLIMSFMGLIRLTSYYIYVYFFLISFLYGNLKIQGNKLVLGIIMILYFTVYGVRLCTNYFPGTEYKLFFLN